MTASLDDLADITNRDSVLTTVGARRHVAIRLFRRPPLRHASIGLAALAAATALAAPAVAAPLCHDLKGLFTPCPRDRAGHVLKTPVDHASAVVHNEEQETKHREAHERHVREHPDEPEKPALVRTGKLCHDSKGLFKPC